eukprot:COSAG06_NODE_9405_length_1909_cov_20.006630_1_plen_126_part_10
MAEEEFCDITGADPEEAAEWLARYNGDSKLAMEHYFQQSKEDEDAKLSQALAEVGVAARGASAQSMKEALKAHYKGKDMTPREVFDALDEDGSGFLDREEIEKASGVLGAGLGFIMSSEELDRQFR